MNQLHHLRILYFVDVDDGDGDVTAVDSAELCLYCYLAGCLVVG